jgi:hypothetical protein
MHHHRDKNRKVRPDPECNVHRNRVNVPDFVGHEDLHLWDLYHMMLAAEKIDANIRLVLQVPHVRQSWARFRKAGGFTAADLYNLMQGGIVRRSTVQNGHLSVVRGRKRPRLPKIVSNDDDPEAA